MLQPDNPPHHWHNGIEASLHGLLVRQQALVFRYIGEWMTARPAAVGQTRRIGRRRRYSNAECCALRWEYWLTGACLQSAVRRT
jgi:hypothetical protein